MPIFYTDNPLNVTASTGLAVTASIANPVTITGMWSGSAVPVTSSQALPVWITGTIASVSTNPSVVTTGTTFPSSASLTAFVSGGSNTTVFGRVGTGTMASALLVTLASDQTTIGVSSTVGTPIWVTASVSTPLYVQVTGSVPVNTGTFPVVTVAAHAVTQGGAWASFVSGTVGVTNSGAFAALVSGTVGATQSGAFSVQISGTVASGSQAAIGPPVVIAGVDATNTVRSLLTTPAGAAIVTSSVSAPVYVQVTGNLPVATGTFPVVVVTQGGAWSVNATGAIGIVQSGALTTQVSGVFNAPVWVTSTIAAPVQIASDRGPIGITGSLTASLDKSGLASIVQIQVGNASTLLLAANAARKGATIFNTAQTVFVALGQTPTTSIYATKIPSSSYYEVPYNYTGSINAIAAASGQAVNVQEFT